MSRKNLLEKLWEKFSKIFFLFFSLIFLSSYLSFLIRFNLRANLSRYTRGTGGNFYFFFGQFPLSHEKDVNWTKLLGILFFIYFPIKLIVKFSLDYFQKCYGRLITVFLTKKFLSFATKNKELISEKKSDKLIIFTNSVPNFSREILYIFIKFSGSFFDIVLEVYSLYFLISNRDLQNRVPLIIWFILIILTIFSLFRLVFHPFVEKSEQKKWNYQEKEQKQISYFLENLNFVLPTTNLEKIFNLLDKNSPTMFLSFFNSVFFRLPNLLIPEISILFLFFYYSGKNHLIDWNIYLIALNCQSILWKIGWIFDLSPHFTSCQRNYSQLKSFFY